MNLPPKLQAIADGLFEEDHEAWARSVEGTPYKSFGEVILRSLGRAEDAILAVGDAVDDEAQLAVLEETVRHEAQVVTVVYACGRLIQQTARPTVQWFEKLDLLAAVGARAAAKRRETARQENEEFVRDVDQALARAEAEGQSKNWAYARIGLRRNMTPGAVKSKLRRAKKAGTQP